MGCMLSFSLKKRQKKTPPNMDSVFFFCVGVAGFEPATSCSQSRRDDRTTLYPDYFSAWRREGDSNPRYSFPVRQFSKLVVSATHPPLRVSDKISAVLQSLNELPVKRNAKVGRFFNSANFCRKKNHLI